MNIPDLTLTPVQEKQLKAYAGLLRQWNPTINLVAPGTLPDLEVRHIADSAQLAPHLPVEPTHILDVGSGAGLPGIILAILCPQHTFTLAERDQRKSAFLLTAAHTLGLSNVQVHAGDVRALPEKTYGLITARAWASLADILELTNPLRAQNAGWLLLKGEAVDAEITAYQGGAKSTSAMTFTRTPSITNAKACILQVRPAATTGTAG